MSPSVVEWAALFTVQACCVPMVSGAQFSGVFFDGEGSDLEQLQLLDIARRSLGEVPGPASRADAEIQTMPMLYSGVEDGLLEGPTWGAYWTQNSYGTAMTTMPFLGDVAMHGLRESQNWWIDNMADGSTVNYRNVWSAPDGTMCDNGEPNGCNYKQGDGDVPIHDWTLEETLSAVVMQAELLLINRNISAIKWNLPRFLRTFNLIEGRRDFATGGMLFLSGPSSNLLAPSFGGWQLENGKHAWSYMTGIAVTYAAGLIRAIECAKLVAAVRMPIGAPGVEWNGTQFQALFEHRLTQVRTSLPQLLSPTGDYFIRSLDPNGTLHGVIGYFEASPNHDAVALGVVNDTLGEQIISKIKALGAAIRPNVFILPNTDATGKASVQGSGAVGYDDMACGNGTKCGGIFEFGTWVNGGVWTTTEGRWLMAAARMGDLTPAFDSMRQMQKLFGSTWRMDNPLVNFGLAPYQPDEDINLTVDNFATAGGLLRGLFNYLYTATSLQLTPLVPDTVTELQQKFAVRWGPYALQLSTVGVRSSGIASVSLNGQPLSSSAFTSTTIQLELDAMPAASTGSLAALTSEISTERTTVTIHIKFKQHGPYYTTAAGGTDGGRSLSAHVKSHDDSAADPPTTGLVGWWHASDLSGPVGGNISIWKNRVPGAPAATYPGTHSCADPGRARPPVLSKTGALFEEPGYLCATLPTDGPKTLVAAFTASGSQSTDWGCLLCGRGEADQDAGGFDGITAGGPGPQVNLDWTGSDDDTHPGYAVGRRPTVAIATFAAEGTTSFVNGCEESTQPAHLETALATMIGARADPLFKYGRFFAGTIHELQVFNRSLNTSEIVALSAQLSHTWHVSANDSQCNAERPKPGAKPAHHCAGEASTLTLAGPSNATIVKLRNFVLATSAPPLNTTHAAALARLALAYVDGWHERCEGLTNNSIPALRSFKSERASLVAMAKTAKAAAAGLANFLNHTVSHSIEPTAKPLLAAWAHSTF